MSKLEITDSDLKQLAKSIFMAKWRARVNHPFSKVWRMYSNTDAPYRAIATQLNITLTMAFRLYQECLSVAITRRDGRTYQEDRARDAALKQGYLGQEIPEDHYAAATCRLLRRKGFLVQTPTRKVARQWRQLHRSLLVNGHRCYIKVCRKAFRPNKTCPEINYAFFNISYSTLLKNDYLILTVDIKGHPKNNYVVSTSELKSAFSRGRDRQSFYILLKQRSRNLPTIINWRFCKSNWEQLRQPKGSSS